MEQANLLVSVEGWVQQANLFARVEGQAGQTNLLPDLVSYLVGALSQVNHRGLHQGCSESERTGESG